jgi:hypothetical protein
MDASCTSAARGESRHSADRRARRSTLRSAPACIAVDWSGAMSGERKRIWLAESRRVEGARRPADEQSESAARTGGIQLTRIESGRDRAETIAELIETARRDPRVVVGLDFAFSGPAWFLARLGVRSARELWELAAREGERWLAESPHPFWGKPGVRCPRFDAAHPAWRATEGEAVRERGIGPKSVFQIGGAGSVGTGSVRGMPYLRDLQHAGFSIWPFDPPRLPMAVEIYPRQLTGPVNKSSRIARALYLQARFADQPDACLRAAEASEDAFDAAVSALRMQRHARQLLRGPVAYLPSDALEGRIWRPARDVVVERCA